MNIESAKTPTITKTSESQTASSQTSSTNASANTSSFKEELNAAKSQEVKAAQDAQKKNENEAETSITQNNTTEDNAQTVQQAVQTNVANQLKIDQDKKDKREDTLNDSKITKISNPLDELSSKIGAINEIKAPINNKVQSVDTKEKDLLSSGNNYCTTMKMDNKDITFFLNLVQNQQMSAQSTQIQNQNVVNNNFTEIKTKATNAPVQVSQTLLDALNESVKTGKPFRIDFDKDIAVVMKVDKNGVLSANFIPGDAAVENYLRNNIEGLRQSFNEQGLNYNELSYSKQQKQEQQERQSKNKENEDE